VRTRWKGSGTVEVGPPDERGAHRQFVFRYLGFPRPQGVAAVNVTVPVKKARPSVKHKAGSKPSVIARKLWNAPVATAIRRGGAIVGGHG
jgi:hypothetical protein